MRRIVVCVVLAGLLFIPGIRGVSAGQQRPSPTITYVVRSGDTLWGIARRHGGSGDIRQRVHDLMERNGLRTAGLRTGQILHLPA